MAEKREGKAGDSAEKAYAAAAETALAKSASATPAEEALVAFPPKARRNGKSAASAKAPAPSVEGAAPAPQEVEVVAAPAPKAVTAPAPKAAQVTVKKAAAKKSKPRKVSPASKSAVKKTSTALKIPTIAQLKDKIMATTKTPDFTEGFKGVIADVQTKAKEAFEKSTSAFGDANEFTKCNVEAFVESGKILASGLQDMGTSLAAESRSAFETITADVKELATVKSPTDFFKLQGEIVRRNFETAIASSSKHSEELMKLASDVFAPLSGRVSVAVEKVRKVA